VHLALILGAVAVFTLLAALAFQTRSTKGRYGLASDSATSNRTKSG